VPTLHTYRIYSGLVYLVLSTGKSKTISPPESEDSYIYHIFTLPAIFLWFTRISGFYYNDYWMSNNSTLVYSAGCPKQLHAQHTSSLRHMTTSQKHDADEEDQRHQHFESST
jgi:hypothetical protein